MEIELTCTFKLLILEYCLKLFSFRLLQYSQAKGYCDDITEGKFSFPVIHAIKSRPNDNQVLSILLLCYLCIIAGTLSVQYLA